MKRVIIIGNSGSGKSYLARKLGERFNLPVVHLDSLFWEPGGFTRKRPKEIVYAEVSELALGETWVVEGVFGELAELCFGNADSLIWLDLDWEACKANLTSRGSESARQLDAQAAEESFARLLQWSSEYWRREGPRSYRGHQELYDKFVANKVHLRSIEQVNDFVNSISEKEGY